MKADSLEKERIKRARIAEEERVHALEVAEEERIKRLQRAVGMAGGYFRRLAEERPDTISEATWKNNAARFFDVDEPVERARSHPRCYSTMRGEHGTSFAPSFLRIVCC